jgi:hypothetical protein
MRLGPELMVWQPIEKRKAAAEFEKFLKRSPERQFAGLAKKRIAALQVPKPLPPPRPGAIRSPAPPQQPTERAVATPVPVRPAPAPGRTAPVTTAKWFTFQGKQLCK